MIYLARCPYRISLLGGGSDLDWWVNEGNYGLSFGASIKNYTYVAISTNENLKKGILNYSTREIYTSNEYISHPIIRSVFLKYKLSEYIEMSSFGSEASGAGLGGSSSFTNALLSSINSYKSLNLSNEEIAQIAGDIEIEDLGKDIGRQDHYLCALGGINFLKLSKNKLIEKSFIFNENQVKQLGEFFSGMVLVNTGISRNANSVLNKIKLSRQDSFEKILKIRKLADQFLNSLKINKEIDIDLLEFLINKSWSEKKNLNGVLNPSLYKIEEDLHSLGITSIKLLGAGGGGSFLCKPKADIEIFRDELKNLGYLSSTIEIDKEGLKAFSF